MKSKMIEPDWSESKTNSLEMWKNPLIPQHERLLIADGAVAFQRAIVDNLRKIIVDLEKQLFDKDN